MTEIEPDFVDAWVRKGRALQHAGNYQDALGSYKRALELDPAQKSIWHEIGEILEKLGKQEEARICYEKAR
jgi:tetratricopeptide (TPR) repeat protein